MDFIKKRRRALLASNRPVCQINILSTSNYVKVNGVTYTSEVHLKFYKPVEIEFSSSTVYTDLIKMSNFEYRLLSVNHNLFDTYKFIAFPGCTYTIRKESSKYDYFGVELTKDWDGVIYDSQYANIPCIPYTYGMTSYPGNFCLYNGKYYWMGPPEDITLGPVDVTRFKTLYYKSPTGYLPTYPGDFDNVYHGSYEITKRWNSYKLSVRDSAGETIYSREVEGGGVTTVDLSGVSGDVYIRLGNYYYETGFAFESIKLLK